MSKYFAKYLPVEGEIKEGDFFVDIIYGKKSRIYTREGGINNIIMSLFHSHNINDCKKVKLFLCSRDIQVGDNVWYEELEHKDVSKAFVESAPYECFKVIGEISPEAGWVKEGDEWEESEVGWRIFIPYEPDFYCPLDYENLDLYEGHVKDVAIKGQCGHFH